jgi:lipopolysaccharide transport system permease protein
MSPALKVLDPQANLAALRELAMLLRRYRELTWEMTRRDILDRYTGQMLGGLWAIGNPLLLMVVYVFAFTFLFRGRLGAEGSPAEYTVYLLAGLAPWVALQEALGRAPAAILSNANLVKQIVFPSEILPLKVALGALPTLLVGLGVAIGFAAVTGTARPIGWALLPAVIVCHVLTTAGLSYFLAALGVFVRDIKDVVSLLLTIGLFLHPILYAPGAAPHALELAFHASPVSDLIWCYRDAVFYGEITRPWSWAVMPLVSAALFAVGYRTFRMLRPTFGNAL